MVVKILKKCLISAFLVFCIALTTVTATYDVALTVDSIPSKYASSGFHVNLTSNNSEPVAGIDVLIVLEGNGMAKKYCEYEDVNECIVYRTDAHGQVWGGIFYGDLYVEGQSYTFHAFVQNATNASVSSSIAIGGLQTPFWIWDITMFYNQNTGLIVGFVVSVVFVSIVVIVIKKGTLWTVNAHKTGR